MAEAQSSGASGSTSGQGNAPSPAAAGGDPGNVSDIREAFRSTQGELQTTKSQLDKISREFGSHRQKAAKDSEIIGKMQEVFNPTPKEANPIEQWESELDHYIAQAVEAEKNGSPIPLTTNLAVKHYQAQIQAYKEKQELMGIVRDLQEKVSQATDPQQTINHQAYSNIDNNLIKGLDSLYGQADDTMDTRQTQFDSISKQIAAEIRGLMKDAPAQWDKIRRSPEIQRNLVNHFLKKNLPPQAVRMMEQENLQKSPMSTQELWSAFREAASIEDPAQRRSVKTEIRQEILERMAQGQKRQR